MGRWTQYDTDAYRLPEGLVRVAYDADASQYTFRDTVSGKLYRSAPGVAYGTLYPVSEFHTSRPNAFAPEGRPRSPSKAQNPSTTFYDILPAHAITTSPTSSKPSSRFLASVGTHSRSQSAHVPSPSSNKNVLHSRSKSETVYNGNYSARHQSHQYVPDVKSSSRPKNHAPPLSSSKDTGKSGFSFSSAFKNLSRTLTTVRVRDRTRQAIPTQHYPGNDIYRRL